MVSLAGKWHPLGNNFNEFYSRNHNKRKSTSNRKSKPSDSGGGTTVSAYCYSFPVKQAAIAASLALAGDTIAQLQQRWVRRKDAAPGAQKPQNVVASLLSEHDWLRALRMTAYGFLFYGPGSYAWYQFLDRTMTKRTVGNLLSKVVLNQVVLGPAVIAVVFAWNNLWLGKLSELPNKFRKDALPTLLFGFRLWIPVSILNFWVVPLQARVAFMSMGSIFWNFCLSSTMCK